MDGPIMEPFNTLIFAILVLGLLLYSLPGITKNQSYAKTQSMKALVYLLFVQFVIYTNYTNQI